jgi:lysophospholipase L1-like esterase
VLLEGINDVRAARGASAEQVVAVYRGLIARARAAGLEVHLATLTPYAGGAGYDRDGERVRQAVNRWIRTTRSVDGVVDVDRALRDPRRPSRLLPAYDPGDHLHPDQDGRAAMARAVDLGALR